VFTGIITDLGSIRAITGDGDKRFEIATMYDTNGIDIGASIACSGVCLTVIDKGPGWFAAMVSNETLSCTTLADWQVGTPVNLERALKVGDELGGHIVSGHVDGVGEIVSIESDADSHRFRFRPPANLANLIATKGSITVDGVSLTVNDVERGEFGINIIPHTMEVTSIGKKHVGATVNLEVDMLARYVARLLEKE